MKAEEAQELTKKAQQEAVNQLDLTIRSMAKAGNRYAVIKLSSFDDDFIKSIEAEYSGGGFEVTIHAGKTLELNW